VTERCAVHLRTPLVLIKPPTPTRFWRRHPLQGTNGRFDPTQCQAACTPTPPAPPSSASQSSQQTLLQIHPCRPGTTTRTQARWPLRRREAGTAPWLRTFDRPSRVSRSRLSASPSPTPCRTRGSRPRRLDSHSRPQAKAVPRTEIYKGDIHMPYSDARFDHLPTSGWPWGSHNDTRISHLETQHKDIVTKLEQLETKLDTLCNKTDDPSGHRNSLSPESDTEGGHTEQESPDDSKDAVSLHHDIQNLKIRSDKLKLEIEALRKEDEEAVEDMLISQQQRLKQRMDAVTDLDSSMEEKENKIKQLTVYAPAAAFTPSVIALPNKSRYAVRIPR
jgi:hypothetical protein